MLTPCLIAERIVRSIVSGSPAWNPQAMLADEMNGMTASSLPGPVAGSVSPRSQLMSIYIVTFRFLAYLFTIRKVNVEKRLQYRETRDQFLFMELRVWGLSLSVKCHFSCLLHFGQEAGYYNRPWQLRISANSSMVGRVCIKTGGVRSCALTIVY